MKPKRLEPHFSTLTSKSVFVPARVRRVRTHSRGPSLDIAMFAVVVQWFRAQILRKSTSERAYRPPFSKIPRLSLKSVMNMNDFSIGVVPSILPAQASAGQLGNLHQRTPRAGWLPAPGQLFSYTPLLHHASFGDSPCLFLPMLTVSGSACVCRCSSNSRRTNELLTNQ